MCDRAAAPLLDRGAGGRAPGFLLGETLAPADYPCYDLTSHRPGSEGSSGAVRLADVVELRAPRDFKNGANLAPMLTLLLISAIVLVGFGAFAWAYEP
jgi:hypothetical protein